MSGPQHPGPTVRPTSWQSVGVAAVIGAGVGWSLFSAVDRFGWPVPQLPVVVTLAIAVLAVAIGWLAVRTHRAIQVRREAVPPARAVTLLVLGKSCLLAGAGLAAGYAAIAVYFWGRWDAALPRQRVISSLIGVAASIGLGAAGAFLERACRVPGDDPDATPPTFPGSPPSAG